MMQQFKSQLATAGSFYVLLKLTLHTKKSQYFQGAVSFQEIY